MAGGGGGGDYVRIGAESIQEILVPSCLPLNFAVNLNCSKNKVY